MGSRVTETVEALWNAGAQHNDISIATLPGIVAAYMSLVERYRRNKLTGAEKKEVVTRLVVRLFDESDVAGAWEPLVLQTIPPMIDVLVQVDRGEIRINRKLVRRVKAGFRSLFICGNK